MVVLLVSLMSPHAWAKGSSLRIEQDSYEPGDRAVAHAVVETWPGSGQPEDGPYAVYLVRSGPLWYCYLLPGAPSVGERGSASSCRTRPRLGKPTRSASSSTCHGCQAAGTTCGSVHPARAARGAGSDSVISSTERLVVTHSGASPAQATSRPGEPDPTQTLVSATSLWQPIGLAMLVAIASRMTLLVRRRGRTSA